MAVGLRFGQMRLRTLLLFVLLAGPLIGIGGPPIYELGVSILCTEESPPRRRRAPWEIEPVSGSNLSDTSIVEEIPSVEVALVIHVRFGQPRKIDLHGAPRRISIRDSSIAQFSQRNRHSFEIHGVSPGITTMWITRADGSEERYLVRVTM